jgi:hypothetical protein
MFTGRTPESLIPRSDSRNPATTCKGITKSGRPCRRPIDAKASEDDGVIAVVSVVSDDSGEDEIGAAAYFCWQHKDQAEHLAAQASSGPATQLYPLKERNSIDTLVGRLGILDLEEPEETARRKKKGTRQDNRTSGSRPPRRINRPATWDNVEGPLMSVPSDVMAERKRRDHRPPKPLPQKKKQSFWASLCCGSADDEYTEVVRNKRTADQESKSHAQETPMQQVQPQGQSRRHSAQAPRPQSSSRPPSRPPPSSRPSNDPPVRKPLGEKSARPLNKVSREDSETAILLHYIPKNVAPQLAATLLAELSKPISPHDDAGYIYIFWLTPESAGPAPAIAASTLLAPPSRPDQSRRRTSDVMRQYSVKTPQQRARPGTANANAIDEKEKDTILLKIGRANNVTRRMNEWTRQCGYSLSLVRYYPYTSSSSPQPPPLSSSPKASPSSPAGRKVPHAHRVERLIHLELAAQRVIKQCDACGKSHKEWFEVDASKEGVKAVDEVVKRWCDWAERKGDE